MADTTFLSLRGRTFWYVRDVPLKLRQWAPAPQTGKAHYRVNLKTSDLYEAQRRRPELNAMFDHMLRTAEANMKKGEVDPLLAEALGYQAFISQDDSEHGGRNQAIAEDLVHDRIPAIEKRYGEAAAIKFAAKALGIKGGVAIDEHLAEFNAELGGRAHSQWRREKAIKELAEWRSSLYLHSFDAALCREYVQTKLAPGRKVATINSYLGVLAQYWRWSMNKGYLKEAPIHWTKHRRTKQLKRAAERARPFTQEEIRLLFCGKERMEGLLLDYATAAALTGARQIEIGELRSADLNFDRALIHLPGEKTEAADRTIPLHSHLIPIFKARCAGKSPDDYVFHELPTRKEGDLKPRSSVISKAFTRFRRKVGVGFDAERKERSPVTFHSFRGWLAKELLERGAPKDLVDNLCGWKRGDMIEVYAWTAQRQEQARGFLEMITLPGD